MKETPKESTWYMDISNKTSVAVTKESTGKCLHASIDDQLSNPHNAECVHPTNKQRPNANKSLYTKAWCSGRAYRL